MPKYKFTHDFAEVFSDLVHGAEAVVHRLESRPDVPDSTVVLQPGDELTTSAPIVHAHLKEISDSGKPIDPPVVVDPPADPPVDPPIVAPIDPPVEAPTDKDKK